MPKNVVEPETPQTIWRMRVACWISKTTRAQAHARVRAPTTTHALQHPRERAHTQIYVILMAFPRQQWLRERASMLRYMYIASYLILAHFYIQREVRVLIGPLR